MTVGTVCVCTPFEVVKSSFFPPHERSTVPAMTSRTDCYALIMHTAGGPKVNV